jgi:DNA polymerase III alpha subunit (gram-positive type)
MGLFVQNAHIRCPACGYGPFAGRESSTNNKNGSVYKECRWICPRCTRMIRLDEKTIPAETK